MNFLIFGDATASGCDTEGRMWVGGDATLTGYGVGAQLSACDATNYVLVVGGALSISGGVKGRIWNGGEYISGTAQCGGIWNDLPAPVDFPALQASLTAYSDALAAVPPNGTATDVDGTIAFSGIDTELNVFTVTGTALTNSWGFDVDVPETSTVVVNVTGTSAAFYGGATNLPDGVSCGSSPIALNNSCNRIIWNFPDATEVAISGTAVQGSILAPRAALVSVGAGQVNGTVIVQEYNGGNCTEMHPHYFTGCACSRDVGDGPSACCPTNGEGGSGGTAGAPGTGGWDSGGASGAVTGDLEIWYLPPDGPEGQFVASVDPRLRLCNTSSALVRLDGITIEYWYTHDGTTTDQLAALNWAQVPSTGAAVRLTPIRLGADFVLRVSVSGIQTLGAGACVEFWPNVHGAGWIDAYDVTNDWSYRAGNDYMRNDRVTVHRDGELVWGAEPPTL